MKLVRREGFGTRTYSAAAPGCSWRELHALCISADLRITWHEVLSVHSEHRCSNFARPAKTQGTLGETLGETLDQAPGISFRQSRQHCVAVVHVHRTASTHSHKRGRSVSAALPAVTSAAVIADFQQIPCTLCL